MNKRFNFMTSFICVAVVIIFAIACVFGYLEHKAKIERQVVHREYMKTGD
jgi:hypothetical protein